ncbi:hypothetical protein L9F63_006637, partial [Diploptera punctata]
CYFGGKTCKCKTTLRGRIVIITGASSGIGRELAVLLAQRGAHVVLACRSVLQARELCQHIVKNSRGASNATLTILYLDLNSFKSIRNFVKQLNELGGNLYALVNNAGVFYHPKSKTEDGFDVTFQTNYLGPFLLTYLLLDNLKKSGDGRIINVVSEAHRIPKCLNVFDDYEEESYDYFHVYGISKLCLVLHTHHLSKILQGTGVTVNSVDPGNVETRIYRNFPFLSNPILYALQKPIRLLVVKTPWEGAQGILHAVLSPSLKSTSGKYFSNLKEIEPSPLATSDSLASRLWESSLSWCNLNQ